MADIVLIQPVANRFDRMTARIPNGLLSVAALPEKAGFSIRIIDCRLDDDWENALKKEIGKDTICAGITCSTGRMIISALKVASVIRSIRPDVPIVWGGPHPTLLPEQTLENELADIVVINEGDEVFLELARAITKGSKLSEIKGIGYKEGGRIKINPPSELVKDLDSLPELPYHLVDVRKYSSLTINDLPSIDILTSRGCPYNCGFCSTPVTSKRTWRPMSVAKIVNTIKLLKDRYGIGTFYFIDDNFMVDLKRVKELLETLDKENIRIYWGMQGVRVDSINRMSPELLDKIEKSGCVELSIGIESANPEILNMIDKDLSMEEIFSANSKLINKSFAVKYNMIIGFPGESIEGIKKTIRLAIALHKLNKHAWFPFNVFTPFPGTPMFRRAVESGFRAPKKLEDWEKLESIGWGKYYNHWMSKRDNEFLESVNCTSYLAFSPAFRRMPGRLQRVLLRIYQPFAYFRFSRMFYFMHIEKLILQRIDK